MWLEPLQVAGTHSAIYEAYYHQVDPAGTGAVQAPDAARFLKKSRLSDVVLSKIWDLSDPNGKGYLDKTGLFVALKLVALAQAGRDINMANIHADTPPPKVGELPRVSAAGPPRPAAPSPAPAPSAAASDWSIKPGERDKYNALFESLQPSNGLIAGNKVKGVLMESKLPLDTLGRIWDLADQDRDGMLDRHEFIVAMHLVYKALEKHAVPTTLPPELRARGAPPSRPPSRPPSPARAPPRPAPPAQTNANLLEGLLDLSSPPSSQAPLIAPLSSGPPLSALSSTTLALTPTSAGGGGGGGWVVSAAEKAAFDAQFLAADADRDGLVSGLEIKHVLLGSGLPQHTLAHIWALCDMEGVGKLNRGQFALAMWLVKRALRGEAPPQQLAPNMRPPPEASNPQQVAEAPSLGPQPTPEMEAIAREVDALARERLALEAELAARGRELAASTGEADGLQSELDTLTATLKQLENQKGEAQKRLNDLKAQVEKLRSQVSAQEAAAAETEAEVAARRQAANSLRERERMLHDELERASRHADELNDELSRTVLRVKQANIKITHLEEQHRMISSAVESLAAGGAAAQACLSLRPAFDAAALARLVAGAPEDEEPTNGGFSAMNGGGGSGGGGGGGGGFGAFKDDAFSAQHDPFAPQGGHTDQGAFGADPFAAGAGADPFAGDSFADKPVDPAWESDPFAVLHAPTRASPTPSLPPKRHKTPPPRPAPPRPNPPGKTGMDFVEDPFKDYRYEDPFNIEDPFKDAADSKGDPFARSSSAAIFQPDDFFGAELNGFPKPERGGRVSAPPDPFTRSDFKPSAPDSSPAASDPFTRSDLKPSAPSEDWGWKDTWAADDAWSKPADDAWGANTPNTDDWAGKTDNWANKTDNWANKTDNWANKTDNGPSKTDNWAADFDSNKNLNETWPSTLPSKKEKSPKPVKYAKSLVHTIGGIGRRQKKRGKEEPAPGGAGLSEEQQWAWAAAESARLAAAAERRRRQEDAELQQVLALSRRDK